MIDKILLKFFADVLYIKGSLCSEELDDVYEARNAQDLDNIFEKMMRGEYNANRRGESYYRITAENDAK